MIPLIGASLGGRGPWRTAPSTGTYGSSSPLRAARSIRPPRLMSPRPTKSIGNSSRAPKTSVSTSTYFAEAMLPRRTTSHSGPISSSSARALASSGVR